MTEYLLQQARVGRVPFPAYFYYSWNAAEASRTKPKQIFRSVLRQLADPRSGDALPRYVTDSSILLKGLNRDETVDLIIQVTDRPGYRNSSGGADCD